MAGRSRNPAPSAWVNRIVRMGQEAPDQLLAHPQNPKIHPRGQQVALEGAISELGWLAPVIVNERTGHTLDGHARIGLAISRGEPSVPVAYVDLPPEQEALALATFDPIGSLAVHDREALDALLREVSTGDAALQQFLDQFAAKEGVIPPIDPLKEWEGMPEFDHEDKTAYQTITVHFKDQAAVTTFAALVGQQLTPKTRYLWYPEIEIERYADKRYAPEP